MYRVASSSIAAGFLKQFRAFLSHAAVLWKQIAGIGGNAGGACRFLQFIGNTDSPLTAVEGHPAFPIDPFWFHREHLPPLQAFPWHMAVPDGLQEVREEKSAEKSVRVAEMFV